LLPRYWPKIFIILGQIRNSKSETPLPWAAAVHQGGVIQYLRPSPSREGKLFRSLEFWTLLFVSDVDRISIHRLAFAGRWAYHYRYYLHASPNALSTRSCWSSGGSPVPSWSIWGWSISGKEKFLQAATEEGWKDVLLKNPQSGPELKKLLTGPR